MQVFVPNRCTPSQSFCQTAKEYSLPEGQPPLCAGVRDTRMSSAQSTRAVSRTKSQRFARAEPHTLYPILLCPFRALISPALSHPGCRTDPMGDHVYRKESSRGRASVLRVHCVR